MRAASRLAGLGLALLCACAALAGAVEMTDAQAALLERLQAETGLRAPRRALAGDDGGSAAGSGAAQPRDHIIPEGIFGRAGPAPIPSLPFLGSKDAPSIDVFSERWAAKMEDLVPAAGYPLENHKVVTVDGFILNMYRIPAGASRHTERGRKPVVMLQHGVTLASNSFTLLNANESMAYILADAGFDVWLSNSRGNTYSRGHVFLNQWGQKYWRWSMDDLALVDIPAQIDYALKTSGASKLAYVGHSQGCTLIYMLLSDKPEYNDKVSVVLHVGPVAFIEFIRAPFLKAQPKVKSDQARPPTRPAPPTAPRSTAQRARRRRPPAADRAAAARREPPQWLKNAPLGEFLANRDLSPFVMPFCKHNSTFNEWCTQQLNGMFYGPSVFVPPSDYLLVGTTWPSTVATRNLEHWSQARRHPRARGARAAASRGAAPRAPRRRAPTRAAAAAGGYHESCNMAAYGATVPPEYNLTRITAPQAFFLGARAPRARCAARCAAPPAPGGRPSARPPAAADLPRAAPRGPGSIDIMSTPEDVAEQQRRFAPDVPVVQYLYPRYSHMVRVRALSVCGQGSEGVVEPSGRRGNAPSNPLTLCPAPPPPPPPPPPPQDFVWDRNALYAADMVDVMFRYAPGTF
ncbi:Lip3 [Scenedesmus sp. PABB004]|nr:Lip3 [Scenedesmus sp. PABB004]